MAYVEAIEKRRQEDSFIRYWEPFEYERKVFEAFTPEVKILVVCGGNRSGKTEVGAAVTTAWAEGKDYFKGEKAWSWVKNLPIPDKKARNIWIVGMDFNMLRDVIWREKLMTGAVHPGFIPKDSTVVNIRQDDKQIFFANSAVITGKSADSGSEKFQSASIDLVWIDEECDASVFNECYQRTIDCKGKIIITVTPLTDISSGIREPWIYDLFEAMKGGRKDIKFVYLSMLDNPVVSDEEKEAARKKWQGHPEERARLYGEFVRRSGLVYPMWDRRKHLVAPHRPPKGWSHVVSIDPAATGITAAIWAAVDADRNIVIYREYYESDMTVFQHANRILARTPEGEKIDRWLIDPKWGSQRNAESHKTGVQLYREAGIPVIPPMVGEDFGREASLEYVQATVEPNSRHPKLLVTSDCENFIFEMEHYTWDMFQKGPLKGLSKEKPIKKNDHLLNAFQYLAATRPRPGWRTERSLTDDEKARRATSNSYF